MVGGQSTHSFTTSGPTEHLISYFLVYQFFPTILWHGDGFGSFSLKMEFAGVFFLDRIVHLIDCAATIFFLVFFFLLFSYYCFSLLGGGRGDRFGSTFSGVVGVGVWFFFPPLDLFFSLDLGLVWGSSCIGRILLFSLLLSAEVLRDPHCPFLLVAFGI